MHTEPHKTAVFSGRWDPPHLGHLHTILNIAKMYGRIIIVVLDYPERAACSAEEARDIFNSIFDAMFSDISRSKVDVVINDIHFAQIEFAQYDVFLRNNGACYNHSIYLSGNLEVIENMKRQQIKHRYWPRTDDYLYSGERIRGEIKAGNSLVDYIGGGDNKKGRVL